MKVEELFLCECGSPDHVFYITYDEEWKEVFMYAHLRKKSFWNRLKYGIKYIFGYQSRYGAFDEIILRNEDLAKLQRIIDKAKGNIKEGEQNPLAPDTNTLGGWETTASTEGGEE